jgi:O-antigen/teichoic acid export membrane protein
MVRRAPQETVSASPSKRRSFPLLNLARKFLGESLFRNSAALVIDLGIGAVCGYGALTILTHVFSKNDIGLSATAVAACSMICFITEFGIGYSVPRFLATAKNREAMINTVFTAVLTATFIGAVIFLTLPYARKLYPLGGVAFAIAFVATACFQASQAVLSTVLVADRAADKMVFFGTIPAFSRLAAPAALSFLGALGSFVSRVVPDFVGCVVFGTLVRRRGHRFRLKIDIPETRDLVKFSAGMYVANLVGGIPQLILPLLVLSRVGASQAAFWSIAMAIGALLYQLTGAVNSALLPEVSFRPMERRALLRRATFMSTALMVPALVVAFFIAPFILRIFGESYVSGALVPLRWLIATGFITIVNYIGSSILFIAKKSTMITIGSLVEAITVLVLVMVWATNVTQIAIAWTIANAAYTVLYCLFAFLALREVGGRWEDLGGVQPVLTDTSAPADPTATSQLRALNMLATLAEEQRAADVYWPYYPSMTATQGLFSIAAFRAAERQRRENTGGADSAREARPPRDARPASDDREHRQAFELLFKMAELQRTKPDSPDNVLSDSRRLSRDRPRPRQ